jgi:integrase
LERYLAAHRPVLTAHGGRLSAVTLAFHITALSRAAFGQSGSLHLFRDTTMTSLAIEDPAHAQLAARVLGHAAFTITEKYYSFACSQEATTAWHQTLDGLQSVQTS